MAFIQMPGRAHPAPGLSVADLQHVLDELLRKQWEHGYDAGRRAGLSEAEHAQETGA